MALEGRDFFEQKAKSYDSEKPRTQNVDNIAKGVLNELSFSKEMEIMDFGSGTGLLLANIAPFVGKITAVDVSSSMNDVLKSKVDQIDCELEMIQMDLTKESLDRKFDSIISSMSVHHIDNVPHLFEKFYSLLDENGTIAISDLDKEDGSFHTEDTGVFHFGFDRDEIIGIAQKAGFKDLKIQTVSVIEKPHGTFPVFLMTGKK